MEPENVAELVRLVMETGKKDADIVEKAREYALERYSPEVYVEKMSKIYESALL